MRVGAAELDGYTSIVTGQQRRAMEYVESSLNAFANLNPGAPAEDFREYGLQVLTQAMRTYGDAASAAACMKYDETASRLGYDLPPAEIDNEWDARRVERDVRYLAGKVERGDVGGFVRSMSQRAYDHPLRAANSTVYSNANRESDRRAGMRYARVPTGMETCGFCLMLASQGFVYGTRESAGGGFNSYHRHCDCRVVAGDEFTEVDGYDPDALFERYADARATVEPTSYGDWKALGGLDGAGKTYDKFLSDRIAREIELRDRDWAWTGSEPDIEFEDGAEPLPKEMRCAGRLKSHGFPVTFRATRSLEGKKTSDIMIGRTPWEMKQPHGSGKRNISNQFNEASGQSDRIVIDVSESPWGRSDIEEEVQRQLDLRDDFKEALLVDGEYLRRIKKRT